MVHLVCESSGFRDILEIAYERRYSQYSVNLAKPDLIVPRSRAFTIGGRINARGEELKPFDAAAVERLADELEDSAVEAVAICLLHAYANPAHEVQLKQALADRLPNLVISLSHEVSPEAREFDRLCTTIANAYIQPLMADYLSDLHSRFTQQGLNCPVLMMTASGGMTTLETAARLPIRLVESGPAGCAILAARIAEEAGEGSVLSFDMGGTTAKLCLIDRFRPQTARRFEISRAERFVKGSGMPVRIPVIEMIEIGAGGGSIASVDRLGRVNVGPKSAGSDPGPAAFARGGMMPTVTDADVVQGLIEPERFAEGRLMIDSAAAQSALEVHVGARLGIQSDEAALGVGEIVDENMASAARMHAVESGKDLGARIMIAFGGNGPLHATRVARRAQVGRILIPHDPGVGSAVGFLFASVSFEIIRSRYSALEELDTAGLNNFFESMMEEAEAVVLAGAPNQKLSHRRVAFMRYHGQGHEIEIEMPDRDLVPSDRDTLRAAFESEYRRQFSRTVPGMTIEILNWGLSVSSPAPDLAVYTDHRAASVRTPREFRSVLCEISRKWRKAGVFDRADLNDGDHIIGPALIIEPQTTTLVSSDFTALIDGAGNIWMDRNEEPDQ